MPEETVIVLVIGDIDGECVPPKTELGDEDEVAGDNLVLLSLCVCVTTRVIVVTEREVSETGMLSVVDRELAVIGSAELSKDSTEETGELVKVTCSVTVVVMRLREVLLRCILVEVPVSVPLCDIELVVVGDD
jgi:hypothetical protein